MLPDDDNAFRRFDHQELSVSSRTGYFDFGKPFRRPTRQRWRAATGWSRPRPPAAEMSEPVEPFIYYLDPAVPDRTARRSRSVGCGGTEVLPKRPGFNRCLPGRRHARRHGPDGRPAITGIGRATIQLGPFSARAGIAIGPSSPTPHGRDHQGPPADGLVTGRSPTRTPSRARPG